MKRFIKVIFIFVFSLLFLPKMVFADDKEIVIDFSKLYEDGSNMTMLQDVAFDYLFETGYLTGGCKELAEVCHHYSIFSNSGKELLYYDEDDLLHLADGVTSADNFRVEINHEISPSGKTANFGIVEFKKVGATYSNLNNYDSISVMFGELLPAPDIDTIEIDFSKINKIMEDITIAQYQIFHIMIELDKFIIREGSSIETLDGKKLFDIEFDGTSTSVPSRLTLAEGLTYKDNFEYEFTDEDLQHMPPNISYRKVEFKFGEKPENKPTPKPDDKPPIVNPNTFNNFFYILLVLGLVLIIGKKYLLKVN